MATDVKYCRKCGTQVPKDSMFCPNCGYEFPVTAASQPDTESKPRYCRQCGKANAAAAKFCLYCGYSFDGAASAAREPQYKAVQPGQMSGQSVSGSTLPADTSGKRKSSGRSGKKVLMRLISLVLILAICFGGAGYLWNRYRNPEKLINRVQVFIPNPTAPEAAVRVQASLALQYYVVARLYLEKLSQYDAENVDPEEFKELVDLTVTAFENADKMSAGLLRSVNYWMETDDVREQPEIRVTQEADGNESFIDIFFHKVFAKNEPASQVTAQQIVDAFDKAKYGQKVQAVADLLGTDAKHAYAQLKMAQASLEGAAAMEVAKQADNCVKVATTLKTAGTVAGLVIAAAPVATGAIATMATGEVIATGGAIVMGGINSAVEVTSTSAMLYCGTEDNIVTKSAEKFQNSGLMKTANLVVNIAGVGYNIKNMAQNMGKLMDQADKIDDYEKLLVSMSTNNGKEASDLFGLLSFGLSSIDLNDDRLVSMTPSYIDNGLLIDIADTMTGVDPLQKAAMKKLLEEAGYSKSQSEAVVTTATEMMESGAKPVSAPDDPAPIVPPEEIERILKENEFLAPDNSAFDPDAFISLTDSFMETISEYIVTGPLPTPSGNGQTDSGTPFDGDLPVWINGFWVARMDDGRVGANNGNSYKFEIINDHLLRYQKVTVIENGRTGEPFGSLASKVWEREYTVDPRTGAVLIPVTAVPTSDGGTGYLEALKVPVSADSDTIYGFTQFPKELPDAHFGSPEERVYTYVRRDDLWPEFVYPES